MIVYRELASIERDLGFPAKILYGVSNNIDHHYRAVLIPKRDGGIRYLSVPDIVLKKIQRAIADNILSYYPVSKYATAYRVGSSVQKNARPHIGKRKILKLDIEGFFDNILYSQVKEKVFSEERFSEPIRILLTMLCYYRDSLPQGAPTSPAITNIIMRDFDEQIGEFCNSRGISYTRYCDDMTFSGDLDEREIISMVQEHLKSLGLFLKKRKTAIIPNCKRQTVTGIMVNEKLNLPKAYKKKIRQEIFYIKKYGLDGHLKMLCISDGREYINSLLGRIAFVLHTTPHDTEFVSYKEYVGTIKKHVN